MAKKKVSNSRRAKSEERGVLTVRRSDEDCSATQKLDFLRNHQLLSVGVLIICHCHRPVNEMGQF